MDNLNTASIVKPITYQPLNLVESSEVYGDLMDLITEQKVAYLLMKEILPLMKDSDYDAMYTGEGRPPFSPKVLVFLTVMQFLEGMSDRLVCEQLSVRIDWKIALSLPLNFPGIHHSLLTIFRRRLIQCQLADLSFNQVLNHLKALGLVRKDMKHRIDSTHILANVEKLTRLELLQETLRLFCLDMHDELDNMSEILKQLVIEYSIAKSTYGINTVQRNELIKVAGA
jgi:transposase